MSRKYVGLLCIALLLSCASARAAWNYSSRITFCRYGPKTSMTTTFDLWSPVRRWEPPNEYPYEEVFPQVTSKWNQPRTVGTNPHQGLDLGVPPGTPVYPLFLGWVVTAGTDYIVMYLDLDGDNIKNDYCWAIYYHLSYVDTSLQDKYVGATRMIGNSGSDHLHFGVVRRVSSVDQWAPMERYYTFAAEWNAGKHLDFISCIRRNGNTIIATAYALDENGERALDEGKVKLYHRLSGATSWTQATMTRVPNTGNRDWQFNLGSVYGPGQTVQYMVIAERNLPAEYYRWGVFPAKFERPPASPPDDSWAYDYLTISIQ